MTGTRFEAISLIQQTVMRELKATWEEAFSRALDSMHERCKRPIKADGAILSDGINKHFFSFFCAWVLWAQFRNLIVNCVSPGEIDPVPMG
jgi:hypothetical protein